MKILIVHNAYQQAGGEDLVVECESRLLADNGHIVIEHRRHNDELHDRSRIDMAFAGGSAVWSSVSYRALRDVIAVEKPDLAHFHNTFPLISPSAYYACANANVPVVQTLHNYRILCPAGTFFRNGHVCESCMDCSLPWPGVVHRCYRGNIGATSAIAAMIGTHRLLGTWKKKISLYIALSDFARKKFIEGGLPSDRIVVKPNFIHPDPGPKQGVGDYALYVGRLAEEKGLRTLLTAWSLLREPVPLRIAGDGPMRAEISEQINSKRIVAVELLGSVARREVSKLMHGARFLVFPSLWYEGFPLAIAEAFACGLPAVTSRLGTMAEIIADGRNGLQFVPGDAAGFASAVEWAWTHPAEMEEMGRTARGEYTARYTPDQNYKQLLELYEAVIKNRGDHAARFVTNAQSTEVQ
jgi:glycosyltransferase involved in cell wall biosynthesis